MADNLDKETQEAFTQADHIAATLGSEGWRLIKAKLDERVLDLQNINNLDIEKPETLSIQLAARKMASDLLYEWLKKDVFGFIEQQRVASGATIDKHVDEFIERHK